jgi:hypothetical protein
MDVMFGTFLPKKAMMRDWENEEKGEKNCVRLRYVLVVHHPIDFTDQVRVHVAAFLQLHRHLTCRYPYIYFDACVKENLGTKEHTIYHTISCAYKICQDVLSDFRGRFDVYVGVTEDGTRSLNPWNM